MAADNNLSVVVPAKAGTHTRRLTLLNRGGGRLSLNNRSVWLWVPAFAGTTAECGGKSVANSARRANHFRFGENLSSPQAKNILLYRTPKSVAYADPFRPVKRGRIRDRHDTSGRDAMDAAASGAFFSPDESKAAYGEVVWSWRRDRGVYLAGPYPVGNGDKKRRSPGRARRKPSNHCAGKAGVTG